MVVHGIAFYETCIIDAYRQVWCSPYNAPGQATEGTPLPEPAPPPPKRLTVIEPPMDRYANPATGYSQLANPTQVRQRKVPFYCYPIGADSCEISHCRPTCNLYITRASKP